jgi:hypothetical protein
MRRGLALLIACLSLVLLLTAAAAPAQREEDCTWGASSVVAEEVGGKLAQSEPATSGCIPG